MSNITAVLLVFALGQKEPVIMQEFRSEHACEMKAHRLNEDDTNLSALCVPVNKVHIFDVDING